MNDRISWDPSLIKKFSSSNHYKLLNQLKNEVKKYPLNNKKKTSSIQAMNITLDNKNKSNLSNVENNSFSSNSNQINESDTNKSTVSFNNAKNFSIYNQTTINKNIRQAESSIPNQSKSNNSLSSPTFKERLNQIDMK